MKRNLWILLWIMTTILNVGAQTVSQREFTVKGVLVDSLTNDGEPYATIRIALSETPSEPVRLAVTGLNGKFSERLQLTGDYIITFTSVGKNTVKREFVLSDAMKTVDLGTIPMSEATEMLKGVEVVAQKPLVKAEVDKVTYSIEDDPDSKTNSTLEMLRKVPLVTVDGEDNIKLNGSSSFKVHVNGKPNNMMSSNPTEVLKSLPANSVKSIEVITEPGAKYDAEGIGGILNIITVGGGMEGYTVTLNGGVSDMGANAGAWGTVQVGKFTVTGNYSYGYQKTPRQYTDSGREDYTSDAYKYLETHSMNKNDGYYQFGNIEGSYEIDSLNLITFSMNLFGADFDTNGNGSTRMLDVQHRYAYSYNTLSEANSVMSSVGANFDYQRSFKKKDRFLTFSYRYGGNPNSSESYTKYEDIKDYPYDMSYLRNQYFDNDARTDEHTFQLDYTDPITDVHKIDFGMKYILRDNKSNSKYYKENVSGVYEEDENLTDEFEQTQNILAAYVDYMLKWKKLGAKVGVRYEHTFMNVEYDKMAERNFDVDFDDVVPSAMLSWQLAPTRTIRASYNMRISRPGIWYLNPFRNTSNPTNISYGNPDLESEKSHSLGLTFSSFSAKFNINANLNYSFVNNGIERYSFMNNGVQENTYANIGHVKHTRLSLWMNWNPGNKTRISLNGGGMYSDYRSGKAELHASNHGFQGDLFVSIQQTLPWDLRFSINGGMSSPNISLQGEGSGFSFYGFTLSRSFLKEKRLTVSLRASNLFNKYNTFKNETNTSTFRSWSESKISERSFGVNVSWRFGELKAQVKKVSRSISNDDVKSGGENSTGGGTSPQ